MKDPEQVGNKLNRRDIMQFWIHEGDNYNYESFETDGHMSSNISAHLDAMRLAAAWGYSDHEGYYLSTEDGHLYEIVDPDKDDYWMPQVATEAGMWIERIAKHRQAA